MHGEPELVLEASLCFHLNEDEPGTCWGAGAGALSGVSEDSRGYSVLIKEYRGGSWRT